MKKLLAILGAISITASASSMIVSCKNGDKDDTKYGYIFIDQDGDIKITTQTLLDWYQDTYGKLGKNPNKFLTNFYNIFAVSVFEDVVKENDSVLADKLDPDAIEELKKAYGDEKTVGSIRYTAKQKMEEERKTYLDNKKERNKGWLKHLRSEFPAVKGDQTALENAWISNFILTDADYSAYSNITKILAFGGNASTKWVKGKSTYRLNMTAFSELLKTFKDNFAEKTLNELTGSISSYDLTDEEELNIINIINAIGGKNAIKTSNTEVTTDFSVEFVNSVGQTKWEQLFNSISQRYATVDRDTKIGSINNFLTPEDLINLKLNGVVNPDTFKNYQGEKPSNLTEIVNYIPIYEKNDGTIEAQDAKTSGKIGLLTPSQQFLANEYFETKKPVAVSEVVFKFANADGLDLNKNISLSLFVNSNDDDNNLTNYFRGFNEFYNLVKTDQANSTTGLTQFESFYRGVNSGNLLINNSNDWASTNLSAKNDKGLLTVDNETYSDVAKYSVYDFITKAQTGNGENPTKNTPNSATKAGATWTHENTDIPEAFFVNKYKNLSEVADAKAGMDALFELVEATRRHQAAGDESEASIYQVINEQEGIIAYIDAEGLHFAKIDGYSLLKQQPNLAVQTKANTDLELQQSLAYDAIINTEAKFIPYLMNQSLARTSDQPTEREWDLKNKQMQADIEDMRGVNNLSQHLNYAITNSYERFLVNNSITKVPSSASSVFYNFDYISDLTSSLANTDGNFKDLGQWLWIYLRDALQVDNKELFSLFFETTGSDIDQASINELIEQIENVETTTTAKRVSSYDNKNNAWRKETELNYATQIKDIQSDDPIGKQFENFVPNQSLITDYETTFSDAKIWSTTNSKTWTNYTSQHNTFVYNIDPSSYQRKGKN